MQTTISVIGGGLMGSAVARAVKQGGHDVSSFDLDAARLELLAADGINSATSVADALTRSEMVMLSLPTYGIATAALSAVDDPAAWKGKIIVNLITGTPAEARAFRDLATSRGAEYLDGAILNYPGLVGQTDGMVVFSGPADLWERHSSVLMALGGASEHVAEEIGAAKVLDVATAGALYTIALAGLAEAASYVRAEGLDPRIAVRAAQREAAQLVADVEGALNEVAAGEHATDQATLDVFLEAAEVWEGAMAAVNERADLVDTTIKMLRRARDAGHGKQGFFALVDTLSKGERPA